METSNKTDEMTQLISVVEQIGEAVLATTETVERLAEKVDAIATTVQNQGQQVQQQSYQIFALSDALQAFLNNQSQSGAQIDRLTDVLEHLVTLKQSNLRDLNS
ncbi:hypothetical protein HC931_25205 [Candidatus Gracilibacteria bacterium]|jgi:methyl-accepting chemotaxis protein|nr:hypothetical protein [Candidatus Gracilibacteria bacterium]NJM90304.1 hypothetical protein [Hydrococcus sp. RU_2_2]NJP21924.1 hypothetical protein [Hydrococcus sp. CRU_1_1]